MDFNQEFHKVCKYGSLQDLEDLFTNSKVTPSYVADDGTTLLMCAVDIGAQAEIVSAFIRLGADVNARKENGWTALMIAAQKDHPEVIKALINSGADVNAREENGWTALMIAVQEDHPEVIKALIDGGADVNLKNNDGATAQMIAANKGYFSLEKMLAESNSITEEDFKKLCHNCNATAVLESLKKKNISSCFVFENGETLLRTAIRVVSTPEIIQVLLDFGFDVNAHIDNGGTALTAAAFEGSASIIQTLINAGANTNVVMKDGHTPLTIAAQKNCPKVIDLLIRWGCDVNTAEKEKGRTPLHIAALAGHTETAKALLEGGCYVDTLVGNGYTALMLAAHENYPDIVEALAKAGANVNRRDSQGNTALFHTAENDSADAAESLLMCGAEINILDDIGRSALILAAQKDAHKVIKVLIKHGANSKIQIVEGTALTIAAANDFSNSVRSMLEEGVSPNDIDNCGRTALMVAVEKKASKTIKTLIDGGADLNLQNGDGWTALMFSVYQDASVIKQLLSAGANPHLRNKNGETAFMIAEREKLGTAICTLIDEMGSDEPQALIPSRDPLTLTSLAPSMADTFPLPIPWDSLVVYEKKLPLNKTYDDYNNLRQSVDKTARLTADAFMRKYGEYGNIKTFIENDCGYKYGTQLILLAVDKIVNSFIQMGIYTLDRDGFIEKYYDEGFVWPEANGKIVDKYMDIKLKAEELDAYRTARRESRGRFIGGGFGLTGATKGMMQAGALNLATGAVHGVFNLVAKGISAIGDSIKLSSLYESKKTHATLWKGIYQSVFNLHLSTVEAMRDMGLLEINEKLVPYLFNDNSQIASRIVNNFPQMPKDVVMSEFPKVLLMNPYEDKIYLTMLDLFGDRDGGLERVAKYFGVSCVSVAKKKQVQALYKNLQPQFEVSEEKARSAKKIFVSQCSDNGWTGVNQEFLHEIDKAIDQYSLKARTVEDYIFPTREEANLARKEIKVMKRDLPGKKALWSEQNAVDAFNKLESWHFFSLPALKEKENLENFLRYAEQQARLTHGILFENREARDVAKHFFDSLGQIHHGLTQDMVNAFVEEAFPAVLAQDAQFRSFYILLMNQICELAAYLHRPNSNRGSEEKGLSLELILQLREKGPDGVTWRMEDSDLVWVNELVDSYRGVYDIKIRTVNGVILPTIEEANATREEMEQVRGLLDGLDYTGSVVDIEEADRRLSTYVAKSDVVNDWISSLRRTFDEQLRTVESTVFSTYEEAVAARREFAYLQSLLQGLSWHESDVEAQEAMTRIANYKPQTSVGIALVNEMKILAERFDEQSRTVNCHGNTVVFDSREAADQARSVIFHLEKWHKKLESEIKKEKGEKKKTEGEDKTENEDEPLTKDDIDKIAIMLNDNECPKAIRIIYVNLFRDLFMKWIDKRSVFGRLFNVFFFSGLIFWISKEVVSYWSKFLSWPWWNSVPAGFFTVIIFIFLLACLYGWVEIFLSERKTVRRMKRWIKQQKKVQ